MDLTCDERPSDSPLVETIWRSRSEQPGSFISMAETQYALVVTKYRHRTFLTVRGPATAAAPAYSPEGAEFVGIQFKPGVFVPALPPRMIMERRDLSLPEATGKSFWLNSSAWQYPDYENADTFVDWLVRDGLLVRDPAVAEVLRGQPPAISARTVQRRFMQATGLTYSTLRQIDRARHATTLLKQGVPILDAVFQAGYFDQPHLTRSLKRFVGLTPAQIVDQNRPERLSFLYKTALQEDATL